jgi:hypothetical protein
MPVTNCIAYCILRIAQQIRSLILGRAAYGILRIAYCVLCSFILGAVVYCVLCIVYCTPHFGGTCVWRIAYCVLHSKHVVSFWGELRIAYCVLCSFNVASFWDLGDSCALCSVYCVWHRKCILSFWGELRIAYMYYVLRIAYWVLCVAYCVLQDRRNIVYHLTKFEKFHP